MKFFFRLLLLVLGMIIQQNIFAQNNEEIKGVQLPAGKGITETIARLMAREAANKKKKIKPVEEEIEPMYPDRKNIPQNPLSPATPGFPYEASNMGAFVPTENSLTAGLSFTGAGRTLDLINSIPPDNMGAIGPTQYITIVNGIIKTFSKTTGVTDGFLNITDAMFWASVSNSVGTSDPRIRYDRKTGRWIVVEINVANTLNRIMIAVSSGPNITGTGSFTFFQFSAASGFDDYPTLGIDDNALYIGTNNFSSGVGSFVKTNGYVIRKSTLLTGTLNVTAFLGLATGVGAGPSTPQGVDNYDNAPTFGYFIGTDNATFGTLMIRRVSNAGTASPSISGNISLPVPTTTNPLGGVPYLGATNGKTLDDLNDRLYAAVIRNDRLWTAHNIQVNTAGVASITGGRDGSRWYEINVNPATPVLIQSGTLFSNAATNPTSYFIPSVMVSGQGHSAFALTSSGQAAFPNTSAAGRLGTDALGTTAAIFNTTASTTTYNLQSGTNTKQRWGDYSLVTLDPIDDMTMWMIHEFCDAANSWGSRVTQLIAPPPATPASCSPASIGYGLASVNVVVTGTSVSGSGFYDPGANLAAPALAFNHISATVTGGVVVNSVTYSDPTHITLNLNTTAALGGNQTFTITNPDGQVINSGAVVINILASLSTDYFRSVTSGNWNAPATWESSTASDFSTALISPATLTPNASANTINIRNGHTVTVTANVTTDQTFVNPGATLIVTGSTLTISGNGLTIQSDATGTGRIGTSTGTITGNATVERYINSDVVGRKWHLLSGIATTTAQTIRASWQEGGGAPVTPNIGTWITDAGTPPGFDGPSNSASILKHNTAGANWLSLANTNVSSINAERGYMLFVRGDRFAQPPPNVLQAKTVLRTIGTLNQGTQPTVTVLNASPGYTIMGNPFASPIDLENVLTTTNLGQFFYVWDASIAGNFGVGKFRLVQKTGAATYTATPTTGSDNTTRYIHSGQGFMLKASGGDASVILNESHKTNLLSVVNPIVNTAGNQQIYTELLVADQGATEYVTDAVRVWFNDAYSAGTKDDILKMGNFSDNLSSYREGKKWIVENRPMIVGNDTIFLRTSGISIHNYRLRINTFDFVQTDVTAFLQDTWLNTSRPLSLDGSVTNVDFSVVTADPASANQDRFRIVFVGKRVDVTIGGKGINIYPNPVTGSSIGMQFNDIVAGVYQLRLVNTVGQLILSRSIEHNGTPTFYNIDINRQVSAGSYRMEIIKPDKSRLTRVLTIAKQ